MPLSEPHSGNSASESSPPDSQKVPNTSQSQNSKAVKKTRYRVPTVCSVCRRRKMKCDKAKPFCTSCVKNQTTHLCIYEEQPWANNNEVQKLKDQIFALQQQNNELKNLLSQKNSSTEISPNSTNYNFIIPGQPANDPILELTRDFDLLMMKESKMSHYGSTSYMAVVSNDPILREMFKAYLSAQTWGINFNKYFLYDQGILPENTNGMCGNLGPQDTGSSIFDNHSASADIDSLVAKINGLLPSRDVVNALIDHFFAATYAFVPFLDENAFRKNMEALISTTPEGKATLVVGSVPILVSVSVLLCVLRLSFISLPAKLSTEALNNPVISKILQSNISIGPIFIEYSKACISNASALRKPTLKHIQALLILRLYRFYAPEDGDESTDSTIFLALIVQMAKMHGLHRDPSKFSVVTDHATANIWRKIWAQLMFLDCTQAYQFGCPLLIDDEYDTLLPTPGPNDSLLEKVCIESLKKQHEVTLLQREIVKCCSKIKDHPKRSILENQLRNVEFAIQRYPSLDKLRSINDPNESYLSKISKFGDLSNKIALYVLYASTYYIMMLTCGREEIGLTQKYTSRAAEGSFVLSKLFHNYAEDPITFCAASVNFEPFLSAKIFEASKRISQATASFTLRDLSNLLNLEKIVDSFELGDSNGIKEWVRPQIDGLTIGDQCIIRTEELVEFCQRLSNRYFVCWRMVHINTLFLEYLDAQFPGKIDFLHTKIIEHNKLPNSKKINLDLRVAQLPTKTAEQSNNNEFWNLLVDSGNQSSFDYLSPNFNRFDNIDDPFMNKCDLSGASNFFTFQDYNSFMTSENATPLGGLNGALGLNDPRKASSSTEDVSPKTDDSNYNIAEKGTNLEFGAIDPKFTSGNPLGLSESEIALQVARSMFGSSSSNNDVFFS